MGLLPTGLPCLVKGRICLQQHRGGGGKVSDGVGKVSDGVRKVSYGVGKVSDGVGKV